MKGGLRVGTVIVELGTSGGSRCVCLSIGREEYAVRKNGVYSLLQC